ncbi:MAG: dihydrofolate reductase, partial [Saprospiraceae bacterium]|nr:dihydrofolate reductase [Saprospiraceae bacterium]
IMYDMNYRYNLEIRKAFDHILAGYGGNKDSEDWQNFMIYVKRVWFSSGIHHHYSMQKFTPGFTRDYLNILLSETKTTLSDEAMQAIFDPDKDPKKVNLDPNKDLLLASAVNFYAPDISQQEAESYYSSMAKEDGPQPLSHGLNSRLVKDANGSLTEEIYHSGGLYGKAIDQIIYWLEKAKSVAENEEQGHALQLLIEYYRTGDLKKWDEYNIAWVQATDGDIDYIQGFVEVYNDPMGYKGSYESIVQIKDFAASERMKVLSDNAQWFEDHSTILDTHKKKSVVGITYKVVNVAGESGDASPSTPIGVNLPNANWIRADYGSKSVSLGNIIDAYDQASGPGLLNEFAADQEEIDRAAAYGGIADKLSTALHEVIGHASGQLEPGVGTPKETLKNYSSTLEEARADIVALYFIMDPMMIEMGLMDTIDVAKAEYESYLRNGLMLQLRRIEAGKNIEQAHMRNRQMVSNWVYEKGKAENVVEMVKKDGKTYVKINDYNKLRALFGELLKEVQRIKSQGDYEAGKNLIETYGVKVDQAIHQEVLSRSEKLNIPPYGGFINPRYVAEKDANGEIIDIKIEY